MEIIFQFLIFNNMIKFNFKNKFFQQKIRLSADFLTEFSADAQRPGLSSQTLPQTSHNVKYVDLTGIEPANPDFSDLDVHQYQAHIKLVYQITKKIATACFAVLAMTIFLTFVTKPALASELSNQFTISLWVNPETSVTSKALVGKAEELRIFTNASGYPGCQIKSSSTWQTAATGTTALTLKSWSYITCTYDKTNLKIFVNGVQVGSQALSVSLDDTANNFKIGQDDSSDASYSNLIGTVDQFQVYNYARTQKQIVSDMNAGHPAVGSPVGSPVAYWKFDEGDGTTAYDSTPNGLNLSFGAATKSWTKSGVFGNAFNGDGTKWLITANHTPFNFGTGGFSISFWFKSDSADNPFSTEYIIDKKATGGSQAKGYTIYAKTDGTVCFEIDDDSNWLSSDLACTSNDVYDNTWHHMVAVKRETTGIYIYDNGKLSGSDTSIQSTESLSNNKSLLIGNNDNAAGDDLNADLDEMKIYGYDLTEDEIKIEYNFGNSLLLGTLSDNSSYPKLSGNQEYCVPGDTTSCAAPVGEWKLEQGTGNSVFDTSGNMYTGTLTSTTPTPPFWTNAKKGKGLGFNGTSAFVDMGNPTGLRLTGSATWMAWIKTNSASSNQSVISKMGNTNYRSWSLDIQETGTGTGIFTFQIVIGTGGNNTASRKSSTQPSAGTWYHLAGVYNASAETLDIYVNGKLDNDTLSAAVPGIQNDSGINVHIGKRANGNFFFFNGIIDEVKVFNYARTPAQIAWDYNRGAPVGHWKLDECQGETAYDSSGNGNHGTITIGATEPQTSAGTCTSGNSAHAWYNGVSGKRNRSLNFDGTDDSISVANTISDVQSVSFWVKPSTSTANILALNGSAYITASSGTISATGFTSPTIYVNGVSGGTLTGGAWNHVTITTGTGISASAITFGLANSVYLNGQLDEIVVYNYALTGTQVKDLYNGGVVRFGPSAGSP